MEPTTIEEALNSTNAIEWKKGMKSEVDSFFQNETWVAAKLPEGKKPKKTNWVFKIKHEADGTIRYKAKMVVRGFTQIKGIDKRPIPQLLDIRQ